MQTKIAVLALVIMTTVQAGHYDRCKYEKIKYVDGESRLEEKCDYKYSDYRCHENNRIFKTSIPTKPMQQTPEPNFDKHDLNYLEIPNNFDNFNNNIISVGFGVWDDGDYSQIFNWV